MFSMKSNFGEGLLNQYTKLENIGKGAYGEVYKAQDNKNKQIVAIKKILIQYQDQGLPSTSIRQISLLRQIQNKNIVQLKDVIINKKQIHLVLEYVDRDLKCYIENIGPNNFLDQMKVKKFLKQILSGIADCHRKRIIHRDLKPANILIDKNDCLKIADFGLSRTYSVPVRPYSEEVVTLWYRAPQVLLGSLQYSTPIDIWSIGCIFFQMITKRPLFAGDSKIDQLYRIFRVLGTPNEQIWPGITTLKNYKSTFPNWNHNPIQSIIKQLSNIDQLGLDLLNRMLKYDPNARITAYCALKHPYFKDISQ